MKKKQIKNLICLAISTMMVMGVSVTAFASETNVSTQSVNVITSENEINQLLLEKGIYEEGEEVIAVIEMNSKAPEKLPENRLIFREIYTKFSSRSEGTKSSAKYNHSYPAGRFDFQEEYADGWQLTANLGIKAEVFEAELGYSLNGTTTDTWTYYSDPIPYKFTVKAYVNYEKEYYDTYDKDLIYDDYIGRAVVERETGYTIKVTKQ